MGISSKLKIEKPSSNGLVRQCLGRNNKALGNALVERGRSTRVHAKTAVEMYITLPFDNIET